MGLLELYEAREEADFYKRTAQGSNTAWWHYREDCLDIDHAIEQREFDEWVEEQNISGWWPIERPRIRRRRGKRTYNKHDIRSIHYSETFDEVDRRALLGAYRAFVLRLRRKGWGSPGWLRAVESGTHFDECQIFAPSAEKLKALGYLMYKPGFGFGEYHITAKGIEKHRSFYQ